MTDATNKLPLLGRGREHFAYVSHRLVSLLMLLLGSGLAVWALAAAKVGELIFVLSFTVFGDLYNSWYLRGVSRVWLADDGLVIRLDGAREMNVSFQSIRSVRSRYPFVMVEFLNAASQRQVFKFYPVDDAAVSVIQGRLL